MRFLALEESVEIPGAGGTDRPATDISLGRQRSLMFQNPDKVWGRSYGPQGLTMNWPQAAVPAVRFGDALIRMKGSVLLVFRRNCWPSLSIFCNASCPVSTRIF